MTQSDLTAERLRRLLDYDQKTGIFTWRLRRGGTALAGSKAGYTSRDGRVNIMISNKNYRASRLAWLWMTGSWPSTLVDHKDSDNSNNRWRNLRLANNSQNSCNALRRSDNTSGYKGVSLDHRRGTFRARVHANGKEICLGYFSSAELAHAAYAKAAIRLYGEFAKVA